jgi:hypothetical protein
VRLTDLEELERAYGRLIAALEGEPRAIEGAPEAPDGLGASWASCLRAFERLRAAAPDARAGEDVHAALVRVRRLHAVVSSLAVRSRDAVGSEIARVVGVRGRLPGREGAPTGLSCDVRG